MGAMLKKIKFKSPKLSLPTDVEGILELCGKLIEQSDKIISVLEEAFPGKKQQIQESQETLEKIKEVVEEIEFYVEAFNYIKEKITKIKNDFERITQQKDLMAAKSLYKEIKETKEFLDKLQEQFNKKAGEDPEGSQKKLKDLIDLFFQKCGINKEEFYKKIAEKVKEMENNMGAKE